VTAPDRALAHVFEGGFATDLGSLAEIVTQGSRISIPFLLRAENVYFLLNGGLRKAGGTTKYNSVTIESGEEIRGMIEYVRTGTSGSPTRKRVVHAGTKVLADNNDGTFVAIKTGLEDDKVPNYTVFTDLLIWASDSTVDVPQKWDQTTVSNLGGTPPNFSFSCQHVNRLWAAGDHLHPSRVYYSALLNPEDWSSSDAGHIDVAPDDGDVVTGIFSFRGRLFVWKGSNFGSIYAIVGRTPSDFGLDNFSPEIGGSGPNSIFPMGNDLGFVATDGTIRSLATTEKFGDFEESALSRPITTWIREHVTITALKRIWARTDPTRGYVLFTLPVDSSSVPSFVLCMDYRFDLMRFTLWPAFGGCSVARMSDPNSQNRQILYLGGGDGFLRKTQQTVDMSVDGGAYRYFAKTPYFHYNTQNRMKTLSHFGLGIQGHGAATVNFTVKLGPGAASQTLSVTPALGAPLGEFVLGTDVLGGNEYLTHWGELDAGQFREVSYEIDSNAMGQDIEINAIHAVIETAQNPSYENQV
jgi:hypothetical protein